MNDVELTVIDLLDEAIKHGRHNQASHGRRTARRRAYSAAYSQARSGGASPAEARAAAREAGLARQSERDVRLNRLREAVERRKSSPTPTPTPTPTVSTTSSVSAAEYSKLTRKERQELSRNDPAAYMRGEAALLRADAERYQAEGTPNKLRMAQSNLAEARMFESEANKLDQDRISGTGVFRPRVETPKPTTPVTPPKSSAAKPKPIAKTKTPKIVESTPKPVLSKQEFERRSSEFLSKRDQANAERVRSEMEEQRTSALISAIVNRRGTRVEQPGDEDKLREARAKLPLLTAARIQANNNWSRAFDEWLNFQNEFNPQPSKGKNRKSFDDLELELDNLLDRS